MVLDARWINSFSTGFVGKAATSKFRTIDADFYIEGVLGLLAREEKQVMIALLAFGGTTTAC